MGKEILKQSTYKLWIEYLKRNEEYKTIANRFSNDDRRNFLLSIGRYFELGQKKFAPYPKDVPFYKIANSLLTDRKAKKITVAENKTFAERKQILQKMSDICSRLPNRQQAVYITYFILFGDIFNPLYSFDAWWNIVMQGNKRWNAFIIFHLTPGFISGFFDLDTHSTLETNKRIRQYELEQYLKVYDLRKQRKKWKDIISIVSPEQDLDDEYENTRRIFLRYNENAKKIINNLSSGSFPGSYSPA
ncbi:MAG: hypothetical protein PHU49_07965 [Syntrophorhabdaceae bacterium]|nr:hypothetical protein [Syntrophorhabdaceae bacterium]MDD5243939.1 hypothetical protein [Syntrophorhabdaceae bacterium]